MPALHPALDRIRRSLAAELTDMRIAAERFDRILARVERAYELLSDLTEQTSAAPCSCRGDLKAV